MLLSVVNHNKYYYAGVTRCNYSYAMLWHIMHCMNVDLVLFLVSSDISPIEFDFRELHKIPILPVL